MIGRLIRLLVGLVVLAGAADLWDPALLPHSVPIKLGDLESLRTAFAAVAGVAGFAFVFAAIVPPARKPRRAAPVAFMGDMPDNFEPVIATPPTVEAGSVVSAPVAVAAPVEPLHIAEAPAVVLPVAEALSPEPVHEPVVETAPEPSPAATVLVVHDEAPAATAWDMAPSPAHQPFEPTYAGPVPVEAAHPESVLVATAAVAAPVVAEVHAHAEPEVELPAELAPVAAAPALAVDTPASGRTAFVAATESGDKSRMEGEFDDALEHYEHALDLARANLNAAPGDTQARADLAGALTNVGDIHDEHGRLEPAIQAHEESLHLRRAIAADAPYEKGPLRGLSLGLERLADTREARGHRSRALGLYQESLPIAVRLASEHPDEPLYAKDLETTQARVDELTREMAPPVLEHVED